MSQQQFQSQSLTTNAVMEQVADLFEGHEEFIIGYELFGLQVKADVCVFQVQQVFACWFQHAIPSGQKSC
jgi:hypothetical protein